MLNSIPLCDAHDRVCSQSRRFPGERWEPSSTLRFRRPDRIGDSKGSLTQTIASSRGLQPKSRMTKHLSFAKYAATPQLFVDSVSGGWFAQRLSPSSAYATRSGRPEASSLCILLRPWLGRGTQEEQFDIGRENQLAESQPQHQLSLKAPRGNDAIARLHISGGLNHEKAEAV